MARVLHLFGNLTRHGAQLRTLDVCDAVDKSVATFGFCSLGGREGELDQQIVNSGYNVHYMNVYSIDFPYRFIKTVIREKYTVVHSHVHFSSGYILLLAWLARVPIRVAHFRNTSQHEKIIFGGMIDRCKKIMINCFATNILAVSKSVMCTAWSDDWIQDVRCKIVYNGLPLAKAPFPSECEKVRSTLNLTDDCLLIAHVGRFNVVKNQMFVVDVFNEILKRHPNSKLLLIGKQQTTYADTVRAHIELLNLCDSVNLLGLRTDVLSLLTSADILLFPSLWEGLPGSVLESLSVGTTVIGSDIPPIVEVSSLCDGVSVLSLEEDAAYWAKEVISKDSSREDKLENRKKIRESFSKAPFDLDTATKSMIRIWAS